MSHFVIAKCLQFLGSDEIEKFSCIKNFCIHELICFLLIKCERNGFKKNFIDTLKHKKIFNFLGRLELKNNNNLAISVKNLGKLSQNTNIFSLLKTNLDDFCVDYQNKLENNIKKFAKNPEIYIEKINIDTSIIMFLNENLFEINDKHRNYCLISILLFRKFVMDKIDNLHSAMLILIKNFTNNFFILAKW